MLTQRIKSFFRQAGRRIGPAMTALVGLWMLAGAAPAHAAGTGWQVREVYPVPNGTGRVFWVKPGTTDTAGHYSGDLAAVWTLDSTGKVTAIGPTYGPYPGWKALEISVASDGSTRLEWEIPGTYSGQYNTGAFSGDRVSLWSLNSAGKETSIGPTYGPYAGWREYGFQIAPDNSTRLFWTNRGTTDDNGNYSGDQIALWTLNAVGTETSIGPTYGRYPGWRTYGFQIAQDSTARVLWTNEGTTDDNGNYAGDQAALWKFDVTGKETSIGPTYGRYPGWRTYDFQIAPDNSTRLLWTNQGTSDSNGNYSGDQASLWTLNAAGTETAIGPAYGRYPGWTANYFQIAHDNTVRLLWENQGTTGISGSGSGDQVSLWSLNAVGKETSIGPTYGRYAGWSANEFDIAPDNTVRLLWTNQGTSDTSGNYSGDQAALWTLNAAGTETSIGPTYGRYPGWHASYAVPFSSSATYLVWLHDAPGTSTYGYSSNNDEFSVWTFNGTGTETSTGIAYGPY